MHNGPPRWAGKLRTPGHSVSGCAKGDPEDAEGKSATSTHTPLRRLCLRPTSRTLSARPRERVSVQPRSAWKDLAVVGVNPGEVQYGVPTGRIFWAGTSRQTLPY